MMKDPAGREMTHDQFIAWVMSQAIRNELEMFHGGGAIDPDNPDSDEGFITDKQMRALNIVIRHTVYETLDTLGMRDDGKLSQEQGVKRCLYQIGTVHGYMEPPGSPELEAAYNEITAHFE